MGILSVLQATTCPLAHTAHASRLTGRPTQTIEHAKLPLVPAANGWADALCAKIVSVQPAPRAHRQCMVAKDRAMSRALTNICALDACLMRALSLPAAAVGWAEASRAKLLPVGLVAVAMEPLVSVSRDRTLTRAAA